ncbi:MAG: HXXEE domain-containing protein, partial [Syntrophales bacterium LBB04]|nr:HXXEE domain-containing protein [Syntrophales bacterium LBB04]
NLLSYQRPPILYTLQSLLPKEAVNKMDFVLLSGLFALAVTAHNLEEALLVPTWSQSAGRWHHPVGAREFRFAVAVLTVFAYVAVYLAVVGGKEGVGAYLLAGYALAMLLNVAFPHVLATLVMRRYAPGTLTALLLNLPVTVLLLHQGLQEGYVQAHRLAWVGPLVVVVIVAAIPVLFAIGRLLPSPRIS